MFKVYWTDQYGTVFGHEMPDMTVALTTTQALRDQGNRFVTIVSENPNNVTKMGVADVDADYDWKKRRA
jgi:Neuraminidase (sialidase)